MNVRRLLYVIVAATPAAVGCQHRDGSAVIDKNDVAPQIEPHKQQETDTAKKPVPETGVSAPVVKTEAVDPLASFESLLGKIRSEMPKAFPIQVEHSSEFGTIQLELHTNENSIDIKYDVTKTDSLVTPVTAVATISFDVNGRMFGDDVAGRVSYEVQYSFQKSDWVCKNDSVVKISGVKSRSEVDPELRKLAYLVIEGGMAKKGVTLIIHGFPYKPK